MNADRREASRLANELVRLLESIGDPTMTAGLSLGAMFAKHEIGEMAEVLRLAQMVIDVADGDARKGDLFLGSPLAFALAMRGVARLCLGRCGLEGRPTRRHRFGPCIRPVNPPGCDVVQLHVSRFRTGRCCRMGPPFATLAEALELPSSPVTTSPCWALEPPGVSRSSIGAARTGTVGFELLAKGPRARPEWRLPLLALPFVDIYIAREKARLGDIDGAIELAQTVVDGMFDSGGSIWIALATSVLAEALLQRGGQGDFEDADAAINRLAAVPTDPGFVLHDITLLRLRALLARAHGDEAALSRLSGSLPRHGDIAWLRGAHEVGRGDAMTGAAPSGVVTFLFTDIEGSTRRWEPDTDEMRVALAAHDEVMTPLIKHQRC